ncbi:hypothetical protein ACYUJ6_15385 [Clostridium sp. JNZ X4-2]
MRKLWIKTGSSKLLVFALELDSVRGIRAPPLLLAIVEKLKIL